MKSTLLEEIANWKLESKLEDNLRYFFHISDVNRIEDGSRCYVIGRKGTGKTAISEYLHQENTPLKFSQKLTFKNFPFGDLYDLANKSYSMPNQYITLWKYVIYSSLAKMMIKNPNIDNRFKDKLKNVFSEDPNKTLPRTLKRMGIAFELNLGGVIKVGRNQSLTANETSWVDRVEILEDLIKNNIDDCAYLIIFDELDEDYTAIAEPKGDDRYISLLTSLFKAVQDVKANFPVSRHKVLPVVFLRDDIYDLMEDGDKTKWFDLGIELDWNTDKIKKLLAFRISRAIDPAGVILNFQDAWNHVFTNGEVVFGKAKKKKIPSFDFITRSTQLRPRDYIRYLQVCAESAISKDLPLVSTGIIKKTEKGFSNYLRRELTDEIHGLLPEIRKILDLISQVRKPTFSVEEFKQVYRDEVARNILPERNEENVLRQLFHFSVIGNHTRQNTQVFRYLNKEARLNLNEAICVHKGLFKALQIGI